MWITKRLTLADGQILQGETLIPHEMLAAQAQASDCLLAAQQQASEIIRQAQQQAIQLLEQAECQASERQQQMRQQAEEEFLQHSQRLFQHWQQQQRQQQEQVISECDALLQAALEQLLDEMPPTTRLQALLRQLYRATPPGEDTRLCAPAILMTTLGEMQLPWRLEQDNQLADDALCLRAGPGEIHIRWQTLRRHYLAGLSE